MVSNFFLRGKPTEWHFRNVYETQHDGGWVKVGRIAMSGVNETEANVKIREAGKQLPQGQFLSTHIHGPCESEKEALEM